MLNFSKDLVDNASQEDCEQDNMENAKEFAFPFTLIHNTFNVQIGNYILIELGMLSNYHIHLTFRLYPYMNAVL